MKKKTLAIFLSLAMVIAMLPTAAFASVFTDMPNNWSTTALENAVNNGLLVGYNGKIMANDNLTRAQMAAIVNRAFGTTEKASLSSYTDVATNTWYYDDMAKAVQMKTLVGNGDGKLNPDSNTNREEAFAVLARAFKLSGASASALDKFSDKALVSIWAKDDVSSLVAAGYVVGYDGQINPTQYITRAEFAQMMDNLLKNYIKTAGTYTTDFNGNVMINVPDVILKNITITGDLIIGDGVGNGDVTLDSVIVTGRTIIRGGGSSNIAVSAINNTTVLVGTTTTKAVTTTPSDASVVAISGTPGVATVSVTGYDITVTGVSVGTSIITVTSSRSGYNNGTTTFTVTVTGTVTGNARPVDLGTAGDYAILSKTGISTDPASNITGNIGVGPITATGITGFSLDLPAGGAWSTSSQVTGNVYAPNYADPTPANLTKAISNMETAYTDAAGRATNYTELYTGDISGKTLTAGVYKWSTDVLINTDVTLNGGANDVWIFQIAGKITQASNKSIILTGGAQAKNIFWQSAKTVAIGTGAHFEGIILGQTNISLGTNASINGRLLAQTAVTLQANTVVAPY